MQQIGPHITLWPFYAAFVISAVVGLITYQVFRLLAGGRYFYTHFHPCVEIVDLDHISSDAPNEI